MSTYREPVHEIFVDKTSCKYEGNIKSTEDLTKKDNKLNEKNHQ